MASCVPAGRFGVPMGERGFTLIELLVVMIIVAVLMAVAVPAYQSNKIKAQASKSKQGAISGYKASLECIANNPNASLRYNDESNPPPMDPDNTNDPQGREMYCDQKHWYINNEKDLFSKSVGTNGCYGPFMISAGEMLWDNYCGFVISAEYAEQVYGPFLTVDDGLLKEPLGGVPSGSDYASYWIVTFSTSADAPVTWIINGDSGERWCRYSIKSGSNFNLRKQKMMCPGSDGTNASRW